MYSLGSVLSCFQFLKSAQKEPISVKLFKKQTNYVYTTPEIVLSILEKNHYIVKSNELWYVTEKAKNYLIIQDLFKKPMTDELKEKIRLFLKENFIYNPPKWVKHVYKGRMECLQKISDGQEKKDMAQLLNEINLLRETTKGAVEWWDELVRVFSPNHENKTETGREGERLSIDYEKKRVGKEPKWEALFSNYSGYDLLSVVSKETNEDLHIEVKTSSNEFRFYLTRGEWEKALEKKNYLFHFWHLPTKKLYIFSPAEIKPHIPINQGEGEWTECVIPLKKEELERFFANLKTEAI